jgi:hypothetical protein
MKVHSHSSQTVFLPRQFSFSSGNPTPNGHVFSSRTPALRAASAEPSAVGPYGPMDSRGSSPDTTVVLPATPVDEKRSAERRWQDKAVLADGSGASSQPAPVTEVARSGLSDTVSDRSQNDHLGSGIKEHASIWMKPGVKFAIQRLAKDTGVSFSSACDTGLEVYARATIRDQEETLFEPRMQAMMRREIRASDKRHLYFEMCNAIAAEQTRVYTADLYKRQLLKEGIPLKEINRKLDNAYTMARNNILRKAKTPQLKNLFDAWWQSTETLPESTGEAGTGKPES